jgi:RNA polymerase sigma-70 factor (ECF subfamily)
MEPLPEEKLLVERFQKGDADSFARLMGHYESYVLGLLWRLTGDRSTAEDLCQEAFLKVLKGIRSFRRDSSFKTWLFRIAHNAALDHLRSRKAQWDEAGEAGREEAEMPTADARQNPQRHVEEAQLHEAVDRAMKELPRAQREVLHMLYWDDFTVSEIAASTGSPEGTVKTLLFRGRRALRERVARICHEVPA